MKVGTDVSLKTCRQEGYMMVEFNVRDLYPNGRKNGIDKDAQVRFFSHLPSYILYEIYGTETPIGVSTIHEERYLSANDLWGMYLKHMESIDKMCGFEVGERLFPENEHDLVSLASDVSDYCGI